MRRPYLSSIVRDALHARDEHITSLMKRSAVILLRRKDDQAAPAWELMKHFVGQIEMEDGLAKREARYELLKRAKEGHVEAQLENINDELDLIRVLVFLGGNCN